LAKIWPFLLVMVFVLGTIYLGVATPTEAAAIGGTSAVVIAMAYRILTLKLLLDSAIATLRTTCMLLLIFICAKILVMSLGYYDVPDLLSNLFLGMASPFMIFVVIIAIYLVLGCFFDAISMMLITVPILLPVIQTLGWSKVWFGVVFTICVEASCLTPPVGVNLFVLQGVTGAPLEQVIKGSWPYIVIILGFTGIMYLWPGLALWLPNLMYGL
jgi:tripartite ATP-independent transporter DctM subunit